MTGTLKAISQDLISSTCTNESRSERSPENNRPLLYVLRACSNEALWTINKLVIYRVVQVEKQESFRQLISFVSSSSLRLEGPLTRSHFSRLQVFGTTIMRITEDGFELAVDSILHILHSEAFERNFVETARRLPNSSSSNHNHINSRTHKRSSRRRAAARKSRHN